MRLYKAIISLVPCLSLALAGQAQTTTNILDWQFSTADNPAVPTAATTINPDGGTPLATFTGSSYNYSFFPRDGAGSPTGTWEIDFGQLQLTMDRSAVGPVSYTLQIFQFIDSNRSFFPGTLSLSPAGFQIPPIESVYVPQSGNMFGSWYEETYSWSAVSLNPSITLGITGGGGSPLLLDEVKLTIVGNLTLVPEPSSSLITAAGLLAFGIRSWLRRKV
jgi:hypothetical protein